MNWNWQWEIVTLFDNGLRVDFICLFADGELLSLDDLEKLPANFAIIFIITFEIGSNVGDNLSSLIFLDQSDEAQNVEYFGNKIF